MGFMREALSAGQKLEVTPTKASTTKETPTVIDGH